MVTVTVEPIPFNLIFGIFVGFTVVLMLKDAVIKIMTFVKGVEFN